MDLSADILCVAVASSSVGSFSGFKKDLYVPTCIPILARVALQKL